MKYPAPRQGLAALLLVASLSAWSAHAQDPVSATLVAPDAAAAVLPDATLALRAIEALPEVRRRSAELDAARAQARLLAMGDSEAELSWIPQDRRMQDGTHYREWELDLSKSVRWPNKVALDRRIGTLGSEAARLAVEDAHHAGARLLLEQWTTWLRASSDARNAGSMRSLLAQERDAVARRVARGDAARMDLLAAEGALAEAEAGAAEAALAEQDARRALTATFPSLPLPQQAPHVGTPPVLDGGDVQWRTRIVTVSHEIGMAERNAEQRDAQARRARADRLPDPVVGIRVLSDLGGREKVYGVILGLPLGVRQRGARAAEAGAQARAAAQDATLVRRDVQLSAAQVVARARALHTLWLQREAARKAAASSLAKTRHAYALGETGITEVLLAAQAEAHATQTAGRAAVDALYATERVRVDAHERWHAHDEEASIGAPDHAAAPKHGLRLPTLGG